MRAGKNGTKLEFDPQHPWKSRVFSALKRQRQVDLYELEASLVYKESFKPARATQQDPVSK